MPPLLDLPPLGPAHHRGYLVDSIESTVARLVEQFGAGPFFAVEDVQMENVTSGGEEAEFGHDAAFGWLGDEVVELVHIKGHSPARVEAGFAGPRPRLHHVGFVVPASTVEEVREALAKGGSPSYLHANLGNLDLSYHDCSATFGHDLEIHADVEDLHGFFAMVREAAEGWDGSDPLRQPPA